MLFKANKRNLRVCRVMLAEAASFMKHTKRNVLTPVSSGPPTVSFELGDEQNILGH